MCGRFAQAIPLGEINKLDLISEIESDYTVSYNVAPAHNAFIITNRTGTITLTESRWGIRQTWSRRNGKQGIVINARVETRYVPCVRVCEFTCK